MKITRVEPIQLRLPDVNERCDGSQETLVVKVHTDAGITGVGEVDSSSLVAKAIIEAPLSHKICRGLAECVLGQEPFEIDRLIHRMYEGTIFFGRQGAVIQAMSGIEIALWDIVGKATRRPVYQLLGGGFRTKFRAYASYAESFADYAKMMKDSPRYQQVLASAGTVQGFAQGLQRAGYATDPAYASKLIGLMDRYDLYRYDAV